MKANVSTAFRAHLALPTTKLSTCWFIVRVDGTKLRFTDHDTDLEVRTWVQPNNIFNGIYTAATGFAASDVATSDALNVDNLQVVGMVNSPAITEADLLAGLWDYADVYIFQVIWDEFQTFIIDHLANDASSAGPMVQRVGKLGEVKLGRGTFQAEIRGLTQLYSRTIGRLYTPGCDADLGDARCTVNIALFTVTGTLTGVNVDNTTVYDTGRAEAGPTGGVAVTNVSNHNPGIVTLASMPFTEGQAVILSGIGGMTNINSITVVHNISGNTFQLPVDTSDLAAYQPYTSGGTCTPFGNSGYFDGGVIKFTSGANSGLSMEVKSYVPGQMVLCLPMPYPLAVGDTYTMKAGCDKQYPTCINRFNNGVNFRGFPDVPGVDSLVQIGRHNG